MKRRPDHPPGAHLEAYPSTGNDDLPVPQVMEEILEVFENTHQERISERVHEKIVDVPVPIAQPGDQACRGSADGRTSTRLPLCLS